MWAAVCVGSPAVGTHAGEGRRDRSDARECSRCSGGAPESPPVAASQDSPAGEAAREALTALRARDLLSARALAQSVLDVYGPDAALFAVLGQAHAAENEDDHDDRADEVYRRASPSSPPTWTCSPPTRSSA